MRAGVGSLAFAALALAPFAPSRPLAARAPIVAPAGDTLTEPPLLENASRKPHTVEVTLTARIARVTLISGTTTEVWAYNGMVPGPTLEAHEGDHVIIHFRNELPEPTTVHWHGVHLAAAMDGSPFYPVAPHTRYDYDFVVPEGSAGTYWYHPHPDRRSAYQVAKGLYGAFIVRPAHEPLPPTIHEKLIVLWDNRLAPDGSVDFPVPDSPRAEIDRENGREGNLLFVNGKLAPTIRIRSGEVQRWRIVNASAARVYRLSIPGQMLLHVGSDGGLFEHPVGVTDVTIANSERVEVLVRGTGAPGTRATLRTLPYDRYAPQTRPADWDTPRDLLTLAYSSAPPVPMPAVPPTLRHIEPLDTTQATARRVIVLSQGLIDNKTMDMSRVDIHSHVGATEIWEIDNVVSMDHPFHLHGFHFQVIDRDGVREPFPSWKDSIDIPKHSSVRIIVRFDDFAGKWMYHCHILDHEDEGMMAVLQLN